MKVSRSLVQYENDHARVRSAVGGFTFSDGTLGLVSDLSAEQRAILPMLIMSVNPRAALKDLPSAPTMATVKAWYERDPTFYEAYMSAWAEWNEWLMTSGSFYATALARAFSPQAIGVLATVMQGDVLRYPGSSDRVIVTVKDRVQAARALLDYAMMSAAAGGAVELDRARRAISDLPPEEQRALIGALLTGRDDDDDG